MDVQYISESIERINQESYELCHSIEYRKGKQINTLKKAIKNFDLNKIKEVIKYHKLDRVALKRGLVNPKELWWNKGTAEFLNSQVTIYSCITGGYDIPIRPILYGDNINAHLYTNTASIECTGWKIIDVSSKFPQYNNRQINRYIKMHPFEINDNNEEFSIYIDGNISVLGDVRPLLSIARKAKSGLALHIHSDRDCIYDEAETCILYSKGNRKGIKDQINRYRIKGFPEHFGLLEAGIIVVDLKNQRAKQILDFWWDEYINSESERDQLSLPYSIWSLGYSMKDIGTLGTNLRKNPKFRIRNLVHNT